MHRLDTVEITIKTFKPSVSHNMYESDFELVWAQGNSTILRPSMKALERLHKCALTGSACSCSYCYVSFVNGHYLIELSRAHVYSNQVQEKGASDYPNAVKSAFC